MKHPGRWLWLVLLIPIAIGLARLRFDTDIFNLLPPDVEAVRVLKLQQAHFANARELIVTLQAPTAEEAQQAAKGLAQELRRETNVIQSVYWQPPWMENPGQTAELIAYLWLNQDPTSLQALTARLAPSQLPEVLAATREELALSMSPEDIARASFDPFRLTELPAEAGARDTAFGQGQGMFASPEGTFRLVFVQAAVDLPDYQACQGWLRQVRAVVKQTLQSQHFTNVTVAYTGRPAFVAEIAAQMEDDMSGSVLATAVIISLLFYLAHRRIKPMLWLLVLLAAVLLCTLALGGLFYGAINVVSMGFAAILLGLAVDYAVVHYQEALAHPTLSIPQIRAAIAPSIFWAAITTIAAFILLNFGGLPGLSQLGTLVAMGVALAAFIMVFEYLPPLFPARRRSQPAGVLGQPAPAQAAAQGWQQSRARTRLVMIASLVLLSATGAVLLPGLPRLDSTANALRPRNSEAYSALEQIKTHLNQEREPLWLILEGKNESEIGQRLKEVEPVLNRAVSRGAIASFTLPTALWPRPLVQEANKPLARELAGRRETLHAAALTNGFSETALAYTDQILNSWVTAANSPGVFWPSNDLSQWIMNKFLARSTTNLLVLGLVQPIVKNGSADVAALKALQAELPAANVFLSGWELLGTSILERVRANVWKTTLPIVALVLVSLILAFRNGREVVLSLCVLGVSALCVLAAMRVAGWSWNLFNLMALPLILGTGVDYSIFMLLALRRFGGDLKLAYRSVGRALLL
ncbi:MAG TPA: MMPL family transporter, partial [Clostridia bacterium]|nr:MMPL family transporter [Clostridia bacterium]